MAALLDEEGLLGRSVIHATDVNVDVLAVGRRGQVSIDKLAARERAYGQAGGRRPLRDHFIVNGGRASLHPRLLDRITWNQHDLVSDSSFNDFHLIICANVLIYYTAPFQERIHGLLHDSLLPFGFLGLGEREFVTLIPHAGCYSPVLPSGGLYKRVR